MEVASFLFKGLLLGFSIAAPVGPIGVLCIRRTISGGVRSGILSGLGAALADALYGLVAAFGLTAISSLLVEYSSVFRLCGGIALLYMGGSIFLARPAEITESESNSGGVSDFGSAFFLTLTNPLTILSFTVIFSGLGVGDVRIGYELAAVIVGGVFLGSLLWWIILSGTVGWFRIRFTPRWLLAVNRISGVIILIFGLISLTTLHS
jgi:threonine/homoserine/homoserine lactone efflux protein